MLKKREEMRIMDDFVHCTGCGACDAVCPVDAIHMQPDAEGFLFPEINPERCTLCGQCRRTCPVNRADTQHQARQTGKPHAALPVYACWASDEKLRRESSSGGAFGVLARQMLSQDGIVFGAAFQDSRRLVHRRVETHGQLEPLLRSKYVQSETEDSFRQVKEALSSNRRVLFCGTPCQVAGLHAFLGDRPEGLVSCDFVCSGVPSPLSWRMHVEAMEKRHGSPVRNVSFRNKSGGWRRNSMQVTFENGAAYNCPTQRDPFFIGFGKELFNRKACAHCRFRTQASSADLTLADFWGIWKAGGENPAFRDDKGMSLVVVHTPVGQKALSDTEHALNRIQRTYEEAESNNPRMTTSRPPSPLRNAYFGAIAAGRTYDDIAHAFMDNSSLRFHVKRLARMLLPARLLQGVRSMLRR